MLAACLLHNTDIADVSDCLSHLRTRYPAQFPDICSQARNQGGGICGIFPPEILKHCIETLTFAETFKE